MILTCPDCATSYFVDDDRVPPQGRSVKCSTCGNRWRAMPEGAPAPEADATSRREPVVDLDDGPRVPRPPMVDDLEVIGPPVVARKSKAGRKFSAPLIAGLVILVLVVAALGGAVVMRQAVVEAVPASAPLFEALGLDVDTLGLSIEAVTSKAMMQGGGPVLAISGVIHNRTEDEVITPPIRIRMLDKDGVTVAGMVARPLNAGVPPGGRRYFAVSFPNPPSGSHDLEITFDAAAMPASPNAHAEPALPAAAAVEAQPLPANSPDALTPHESH